MKRTPSETDILAIQVQQGNLKAKEKLRARLVPGLCLIVRATLQTGQVRSALARQIFHEYRRVSAQVAFPAGPKIPNGLIELVARRLTDNFIEGLRPQSTDIDMSRETVVA